MLCENCGNTISVDSRFCRICGVENKLNTELRAVEGSAERQPYSWQYEDSAKTRTASNTAAFTYKDAAKTNPGQISNYSYPTGKAAPQRTFHCPNCYSGATPFYERRISQAGWIVFAILAFTFPILCWVGLLIKENKLVCRSCNHAI